MNLYLLRQMAMSSDINSTFLSICGNSFPLQSVRHFSLARGIEKTDFGGPQQCYVTARVAGKLCQPLIG